MIVHQGVAAVMIISSDIRGSVATSSFTANGISRSGLSALNPPVCPAHVSRQQKGDGAIGVENLIPEARLKLRWKFLAEWVMIGCNSTFGLRRYRSVCERTGPSA